MQSEPLELIRRKTGNWWQDERRNWCAYCGVGLNREQSYKGLDQATRDHVVPKPLRTSGAPPKSPHLTIPACRCCNDKRGGRQLSEFFNSSRFRKVRARGCPPHGWSLRDLWLLVALAAVQQAYELSDE